MSFKGKIRLLAGIATANSMLALWMLGASPAMATTCNPIGLCFPPQCPVSGHVYCVSQAPPGCTLQSDGCAPGFYFGCQNGYYFLACNYH
jgi:hypothetical protein